MKRFLALFMAAAMIFAFCACSSGETAALKQEILRLEKENKELKEELAELKKEGKKEETKEEKPKDDDDKYDDDDDLPFAKDIYFNETIAVGDLFEMFWIGHEWCEEIKPANTSGVYSYFSDKEGEKYFAVHGTFKNLSANSVDIDRVSRVVITVNGKYNIVGTLKLQDSDEKSFNANVKPMQTLKAVAYASIPDELYEMHENLKITISIVTDEEKLNKFYDDDYKQETYRLTYSR